MKNLEKVFLRVILSLNRFVSTSLSWEIMADDDLSPIAFPISTRCLFFLRLVVSGTTIHVWWLKPRTTTIGRLYNFPLPSCLKPTFAPKLHHQISRSLYIRCSPLLTDVLFYSKCQNLYSFPIYYIIAISLVDYTVISVFVKKAPQWWRQVISH